MLPTMDMWRYFDVTHAQHDVMNPSSGERLEELGGALQLRSGQRVLDLELGALSRDAQRALVAAEELITELKSSPLVSRDSVTLKKFEGTLDEINGLVGDRQCRCSRIRRGRKLPCPETEHERDGFGAR